MYTRHDLTDAEDELVVPRLPPERSGRRGRPYKSHRSVLCAIASILATGGPWRNLPQEVFGPWKTIYNGYRRWATESLFETFALAMLWDLDAKGRLHRDLFCIDATIARAHQSAAGALAPQDDSNEPADHALGYSQGGFGTKIHLLADETGRVLAAQISGSQHHESKSFESVLENCWVIESERKESWPEAVAGDRGYSSNRIREYVQDHQIEDVVARRSNETQNPCFDKHKYRQHNIVEGAVGWLKWFGRMATRYDKTAESYLGFIH